MLNNPNSAPSQPSRTAAAFEQTPSLSQNTLSLERQADAESDNNPTVPAQLVKQPHPQKFGKFELLAQLPVGGMGLVFKVRDSSLDRVVALKTIRSGSGATPSEMERFDKEARAVAHLDHPHIVKIFEHGQQEGYPFFTMEFADGGSLAKRLAEYQADPRRTVELVEKVARGMAHAHLQGILHRDLKPGNILLDKNDTPLVSDFGLAKFLDAAEDMTQEGQVLGTLPYMAPEQAAGHTRLFSAQTDIWALGVVLFELVTGRRPFIASGDESLSDLIRHARPPHPRSIRPMVDKDLEAIILKCLEKEPEDRYASADELADDLHRWLEGELPQVRRVSPFARWGRRTRRFASRHRLALAGVALTLATAVVLAVLMRPSAEDQLIRTRKDFLSRAQNSLRQGKEVVLVGATARDCVYPFHRAGAGYSLEIHDDKPLAVEAFETAFVTLLPDAGVDSYRLECDMRAVKLHKLNMSGIFVGHVRQPGAGGATENWFGVLACTETLGPTGVAQLALSYLADEGPPTKIYYPASVSGIAPMARQSWHQLAVEVSAQETLAFVDGQSLVSCTVKEAMDQLSEKLPNLQTPPAAYGPRGAVGLFVKNGRVEVRNVSIKALTQP